ncbi:hypothetical protein ACOME3_006325 [Neoechinorhynchus agilis]
MEKAIKTQFVEVIEVAEQETEMAGTDGFNEIIKEIAKSFRSYMKNYGKVDLKKTMENGIERYGMKRKVKEELSNEMMKFVERFLAIQSMMCFEVYENDKDNGESMNEEMEIGEEFEEPGDVAREPRKRKSDDGSEIDSEKKRKRCFKSDQCEWLILVADLCYQSDKKMEAVEQNQDSEMLWNERKVEAKEVANEMKQLIVTNEDQILNNAQRIIEFRKKPMEKRKHPKRSTVEEDKSLRVKEIRKRTAGNINEEGEGDWLSSLEELGALRVDTIKSTSVQIVARRKRGKKPRNKSQQCTLTSKRDIEPSADIHKQGESLLNAGRSHGETGIRGAADSRSRQTTRAPNKSSLKQAAKSGMDSKESKAKDIKIERLVPSQIRSAAGRRITPQIPLRSGMKDSAEVKKVYADSLWFRVLSYSINSPSKMRKRSSPMDDEDDRDGWGRSIDQFGELIDTEKDGEQPQGSMDGRQQCASTAS